MQELTRDEKRYLEIIKVVQLLPPLTTCFTGDPKRRNLLSQAAKLPIDHTRFGFEHLFYARSLDAWDFRRLIGENWSPASDVLNLIIQTSDTPSYLKTKLLEEADKFDLTDKSIDCFLRQVGVDKCKINYAHLHLLNTETMDEKLLFDLTLEGNRQAQEELRKRSRLGELCQKALEGRRISCAKMRIIYATGEVEYNIEALIKNFQLRKINALCSINLFPREYADILWLKISYRQEKIWDLHDLVDFYADRVDKIPSLSSRGYPLSLLEKLFHRQWFHITQNLHLAKPLVLERCLLLGEMIELKDIRFCILHFLYSL